MKLFLLGAAALIAAPVMAQVSSSVGSNSTITNSPSQSTDQAAPADPSTMQQTPPTDQSTQTTNAPADGSMQPPMGQGTMGQPPMGAAPTGGQIVMGPMNTTPPPAAVTNPPVCKRGQTDDCIEPGARRARRR
ncbi:hypothetical protein [Sphingomonas aracearum]|uniref:Fe-S oxidoreductase n=1 Tax=Sphingomonas aracearum TaxID=2283317 RepID=A0A369VZE8_9SPHN|nr:hypothetical protein [Sphingomonas aracearum]RDE07007.1 hypothetical protein DVW87_04945 [Sphingomonas aracearum]